MAVNHEPIVKRCRALDISPAVLGYTNKKSFRNPNGAKRKKLSEYGMQLREKQKVKFIYGVLEKQFRNYYKLADRKEGMTGENLISILETRLDNVVFRMNMATTRKEARQLVVHGHFLINGKKADIPSMRVRVGDVISVKETSRKSEKIKSLVENLESYQAPAWLSIDKENVTATVVALPKREDIDYPLEEHLIVELYSK
ncbi:MAG: 30S ribosomal protein S4 [Clostridia bacterium]|nr:30S ribosomal protein S4 [Clostridia bacterium]